MTDRMECLLDDCLTVHLKEIRKICKDKTNNQVMCKSNITAVDFDKISRKYCKKKGVPVYGRCNVYQYEWSVVSYRI